MKNNYTKQQLASGKGYKTKALKTRFLFLLINFLVLSAGSEVFGQTDYGSRTGTNQDGYVINDDNSNHNTFLRLQNSNDKAWRMNHNNGTLEFAYSASGIHYDLGTNHLSLSNAGEFKLFGTSSNYLKIVNNGDGSHHFTNKGFAWYVNGSTMQMYLNPNGNLGIGTGNPTERLDVNGHVKATGRIAAGSFVFNGREAFTKIYEDGNIHYWTDDHTKYESSTTDGSFDWKIGVNNTGAGGTSVMKLQGNKLGIGTTTPTEKLDVNGNIKASGNITATQFVKSGGTASQFLKADGSVDGSSYLTTNSSLTQLKIGTNTTKTEPLIVGDNTNYFTLIPNQDAAHMFSNQAFSFYVGEGTNNQKMVIGATGAEVKGNLSATSILATNKGISTGQGAHLQWNRSDSEGETWLINNRGAGGEQSGIRFGGTGWDLNEPVAEWARFKKNGNFGINQTNPTEKLHVNGNIKATGNLIVGEDNNRYQVISNNDATFISTNKAYHYYLGQNFNELKMSLSSDGLSVGNFIASGNTKSNTLTVGTPTNLAANTVATFGGLVQITPAGATPATFNTTYGDDYLLWVEKGIVTNDVAYAEVAEWADFVFDQKYELMPIQKVAQYIDDNGHLPNIPSAAEVKKDGFTAVDMTKKLLQKIEELTLYSIAQDKKIEALSKAVEQLQNK